MPKLTTTPVLLGFATPVALASFFFHLIIPNGLIFEVVLGYVPIVLGGVCLWLGYSAFRIARHKLSTVAYVVLLTPFAFSYPAWLLFIWTMHASGRYHGPMP
jgi:hypothetical protein